MTRSGTSGTTARASISGVDVALRPWSVEDAPALLAAVRESPDLDRQLGGAALVDLDASRAFVATHLAASDGGGIDLAVTADGVAVGNVGVSHVDPRHGTAWTYYWLTASARGRGLATRALDTVARWAFAELDVFRLELGHRVENPASCRVATRAGFRAEGIERAKLRYGAVRYDVETHARLATDPSPGLDPLPLWVEGPW